MTWMLDFVEEILHTCARVANIEVQPAPDFTGCGKTR